MDKKNRIIVGARYNDLVLKAYLAKARSKQSVLGRRLIDCFVTYVR